MSDTSKLVTDPFEAFADAQRAQASAIGAYVRERDSQIDGRMKRLETQNNEIKAQNSEIIQALGYLRGQLDKRNFES